MPHVHTDIHTNEKINKKDVSATHAYEALISNIHKKVLSKLPPLNG
jgi:hypothetical protein